MKKFFALFVTALLFFAVVLLSGCGKSEKITSEKSGLTDSSLSSFVSAEGGKDSSLSSADSADGTGKFLSDSFEYSDSFNETFSAYVEDDSKTSSEKETVSDKKQNDESGKVNGEGCDSSDSEWIEADF